MMVLGIETSTVVCSVGLATESGLCGEVSLIESHIHSEKLLTLAQQVCDEQAVALSQIHGIAVSLGPGSFTGLRIGLSTGKGLSFALGKPLYAIPTFEAIAHRVFEVHTEITHAVVCIDAKQGEYYIGMFEKKEGTCIAVFPVHVGKISSIINSVNRRTLVVTDRREALNQDCFTVRSVEEVFSYCRGDVIAGLAIKKIKNGGGAAMDDVEPMYLKDFIVRQDAKPVK